MLKLYDTFHNALNPLLNYEGLCVDEQVNGETQISFSAPKQELDKLKEEYYIRTPDNEFVIKEISIGSDDLVKVVAKINIEELKGTPIKYFETIAKTPYSCISLALSYCTGGWTVVSDITKKRTLRQSQKSVWDIIKNCLNLYMAEMRIDAINKVITIKSKVGEDKGCYLMEGLNLSKLDISSDTYDLVTRIYPVGANGLTIADVNDGQLYVENNEYSNKIIAMYWEDNRYTIAEDLRDDALEKLEALAKPSRSYSCSVIDLATAAGLDIFDYNVGDTVWLKSEYANEKHRIVSMKSYPEEPEKNTCVLSTNLSSLVGYVEDNLSASDAVQLVITQDGRIDPSKVDIEGGGGSGVPAGGTTGQALVKLSEADGDVAWRTVFGDGGVLTIEEIEALITIKSQNIQDGAITNAKIGQAAIQSANIADAAITHAKIAEAAIDTTNIVIGSITGALIQSGEITNAHIVDGAINSAKIEDGAITNAKIGLAAIKEANIKDGSITTAKIANAAIDTAKIKDGSINTAKIGQAAIIAAHIQDGSITNVKIANGAIDNAKIADASITSAKILELDAGKITTGLLQTERLLITGESADGSIKSIVLTLNEINGTPQLSTSTIDGGSITKRTISADNIMAGTITGLEIQANSINSTHIQADSITADKIAGGSITLNKIDPSAIDNILNSSKEYTDEAVAYYGEFLQFSAKDGLTIGSNSTPMKTVIDSQEIGFYDGEKKMAYVNSEEFGISRGRIQDQLTFGHYVWQVRDNGNLSVFWRD